MATSIDRSNIDVENEMERVFLQNNWRLLRERLVLNRFRNCADCIPQSIRNDYVEACLSLDRDPKAAALLHRCLQSMIRDFHGITKDKRADAINELQNKITATQWKAIDGMRKSGNIGAHMANDVNLIVSIDPGEAHKLKKLIELLLDKWYIARHEEETFCNEFAGISDSKQT